MTISIKQLESESARFWATFEAWVAELEPEQQEALYAGKPIKKGNVTITLERDGLAIEEEVGHGND